MVRACCSSVRPACVGVTPGAAARQQRRAERLLHAADPRARRGKRKMRAFRAMRDAARLDDVAEQAQVGEVKAHGSLSSFAKVELRRMPIVLS